jgi:hypothetical protein
MGQAVSDAVETVRTARKDRPAGAILIAVGGLSAAGKSLLSRRFQSAIREIGQEAWVLEGDRFILPKARRRPPERYPEDVYELDRLRLALAALRAGDAFLAPFYHKMGAATDRIQAPAGWEGPPSAAERRGDYRVKDASPLLAEHRQRLACARSRLYADAETGDLLEEVPRGGDVWIFDSELALAFSDFRARYDRSYAVWASRARRRRNFLSAVRKGERYPVLSEQEALEKIEGFFLEDDRFNRRHLRHAQVWVDNT